MNGRCGSQLLGLLVFRQGFEPFNVVERCLAKPVLVGLAVIPRWLAPRIRIIAGFAFTVMEYLSERYCRVSVILEMLRQRNDVRHIWPHKVLVVEHAGRVGPGPVQQAAARGIANGNLAIGSLKQHPTRCKSVDVRRLHIRSSVATKLWAKIIDGDEERIKRFSGN